MSRVPWVVCIGGAGATGKSTVGRALARQLRAALIDQDVSTNPLMAEIARARGIALDFTNPLLTGTVRDARYQCLTDAAALNAHVGVDTVLVAPFTSEVASTDSWARLAASVRPGRALLIWLTLDPAVLAQRRHDRGFDRDREPHRAAVMPAHGIPAVMVDGCTRPLQAATAIMSTLSRLESE